MKNLILAVTIAFLITGCTQCGSGTIPPPNQDTITTPTDTLVGDTLGADTLKPND